MTIKMEQAVRDLLAGHWVEPRPEVQERVNIILNEGRFQEMRSNQEESALDYFYREYFLGIPETEFVSAVSMWMAINFYPPLRYFEIYIENYQTMSALVKALVAAFKARYGCIGAKSVDEMEVRDKIWDVVWETLEQRTNDEYSDTAIIFYEVQLQLRLPDMTQEEFASEFVAAYLQFINSKSQSVKRHLEKFLNSMGYFDEPFAL